MLLSPSASSASKRRSDQGVFVLLIECSQCAGDEENTHGATHSQKHSITSSLWKLSLRARLQPWMLLRMQKLMKPMQKRKKLRRMPRSQLLL